jgi:hypothetical protein
MTDIVINRGDLLLDNRTKQFGVIISFRSRTDDECTDNSLFNVAKVHWIDHKNSDSYIQSFYIDTLNNLVRLNQISRYT